MNLTETGWHMKAPWQEHKLWQNPIASIESAGGFALLAHAIDPARTVSDADATLVLDPHPGSIGGAVRGAVKLPRNIERVADCVLRLSCISNFASGHDDYSDGSIEVLWEQELHAAPRSTRNGVEVAFTFDQLPDSLPESQLPIGGSHVDWQLTLTASAENAELRHTFSIPVFATDLYQERPVRSASETEALLSEWRSREAWRPYRAEIKTEADSLIIRLGPWRGGMFQTGGWKGLVAIVLSFFVSVVLLLFANDELVSMLVTGVFGMVGLFVTGLAGYLWIRTVDIRVRPGRLSLRRHIFGQTVQSRTLLAEDISDFTIRYGQLYVVSGEYGELELIDSVDDLRLLNALRRLLVTYLAPA